MVKACYVLVMVLMISGCGKKHEDEAAAKAAKAVGATSAKTGAGSSLDGNHVKHKFLSITLSGINTENHKYNPEKVCASAALVFMDALKAQDYTDCDHIVVILNESDGTADTSGYLISDLKSAKEKMAPIPGFMAAMQQKSYERLPELMDKQYVADSIAIESAGNMGRIDSAYGGVQDFAITGFKVNGADSSDRSITYYTDVKFAKGVIEMDFDITEQTGKIRYIKVAAVKH